MNNESYGTMDEFSLVLEHINANIMLTSRPGIVGFDKENISCKIVNVACPFDTRVAEKEWEKVDKYQNLKYELKRVWNCREVIVIPAVIGPLGCCCEFILLHRLNSNTRLLYTINYKRKLIISKDFHKLINKINPEICFGTLQNLSSWNSEVRPEIRSEYKVVGSNLMLSRIKPAILHQSS